MSWLARAWERVRHFIGGGERQMPDGARNSLGLEYFATILPVELDAINKRRALLDNPKGPVKPLEPPERPERGGDPNLRFRSVAKGFSHPEPCPPERKRSPDPEQLFRGIGSGSPQERHPVDPDRPDPDATRPQPVPCTATGLALSGGGIRSAAVCLGAIQALARRGRFLGIDYLSTVSGGGYIGSCLSAAMSLRGGSSYPFGTDIVDSDAVAHLRNYSNYLMPRGRSGLRNCADAAVIVLRGLLANSVIALTMLLGLALITYALAVGISAVPLLQRFGWQPAGVSLALRTFTSKGPPFVPALMLGAVLALLLIGWAILCSNPKDSQPPSDTRGLLLSSARTFLIATLALAIIGLQPLLIEMVDAVHRMGLNASPLGQWLTSLWVSLAGLTGIISGLSGTIGRFLDATLRTSRKSTIALRLAARGAIFIAACVLPLSLWLAYLILAAALIHAWPMSFPVSPWIHGLFLWKTADDVPPLLAPAMTIFAIGAWICAMLGANGYSLHRFYRDRLSTAFLFDATIRPEPRPLDDLRLSELQGSYGPYHILNAALNIQASAEANRRGRNADFFIFTPDFIGSDLTMYTSNGRRVGLGLAPTIGMEEVVPQLDLATAVAISGAAISANMGSSTIRVLSPTLALLNVRLGYWLSNPRALARKAVVRPGVVTLLRHLREKFWLLTEMLNLQDETSPLVFLSDGGHIENLGIYELLKRGCQTIIAIDAEADPDLAFPSLLKLERYARIDLGVRISLPWEEIAGFARSVGNHIDQGFRPARRGPHCAVGRIYYPDGNVGVLVYFKASLTGDEKDYIIDYRRRNPAFPHETTGDQFFGEEQFEMYRALGYHMVDGVFGRSDEFAYCKDGQEAFRDADQAFQEIDETVPVM